MIVKYEMLATKINFKLTQSVHQLAGQNWNTQNTANLDAVLY